MKYLQYIQLLIEEHSSYGKVCERKVSKYGHIPEVAPEAYNIYMFSPLTQEQLEQLERIIGREVPEQYKLFLTSVSNGMHIFHRCLTLFGLQENLNRQHSSQGPFDIAIPNNHERPFNADSRHFFFGSYSYDGSLLYMTDDADTIYYCARRDASPLKEWSSFSDMLIEEIHRLNSIHNTQGILQLARKDTLPIS